MLHLLHWHNPMLSSYRILLPHLHSPDRTSSSLPSPTNQPTSLPTSYITLSCFHCSQESLTGYQFHSLPTLTCLTAACCSEDISQPVCNKCILCAAANRSFQLPYHCFQFANSFDILIVKLNSKSEGERERYTQREE